MEKTYLNVIKAVVMYVKPIVFLLNVENLKAVLLKSGAR